MDLAKTHQLKIYSMSSRNLSYFDKTFFSAGPLEFLHLIQNADFVISNSFHVSVFSVIYNKSFFVVGRKAGINSRMVNLLSKFDIQDRMITDWEKDKRNVREINFTIVKEKLEEYRLKSMKFIDDSLALSK